MTTVNLKLVFNTSDDYILEQLRKELKLKDQKAAVIKMLQLGFEKYADICDDRGD